MTGGTRIIALDTTPTDGARPLPTGDAPTDDRPMTEDEAPPEFTPQGRLHWVLPALAAVLGLGWTVLFGLARIPHVQGGVTPEALVDLIGAWALPIMLILLGLLIARTTLRDASRHAAVIRALSDESGRLDQRLRAMNTELSLARDFIAAQARDLEALGRIAVDRLSGSADRLKGALGEQSRDIDHIGEVTGRAVDNIEALRSHLPVISNSAKDAANAIAQAGRNAETQLDHLIGGFTRLNEFGQASGRKVEEIRREVDTALDAFALATERIGQAGEVRLRAVIEAIDAQRMRIEREENAGLAAIRARADTLAAELAAQREVISRAEEDSLGALAARIAALDGDVRKVAAGLGRAIEEIGRDHDDLVAASRDRLRRFEDSAHALGRTLHEQAGQADESLAARRQALEAALNAAADGFSARLSALDGAIGQRRAAMAAAAADAADAIETRLSRIDGAIETQRERQAHNIEKLAATCDVLSERVAAFATTISQATDQGTQTGTVVDAALTTLTARLTSARTALGDTDRTVAGLTEAAVRLLELIAAASDHTRTQLPEALRSATAGLDGVENRVVALRDTLREAGDTGVALSGTIDGAGTRLGEIAATGETQERHLAALRDQLRAAQGESERLNTAIAELQGAAEKVGAILQESTAEEITALAARFGEETTTALARVVQGRGAQMIARLEEAMDSASDSARETAVQMRDQLSRIDELAGNLEARVAQARERAEEQVDSDFARRTALITESLNSTAIDVARILAADVSESAWASYMRGERGIFTRRAVSLLDTTEARAVQQHYETDAEFRTHVNHYIHDFEGMLRQLLSTRDGNALGVTLLSSDMGKLYVALAQGIERLRT